MAGEELLVLPSQRHLPFYLSELALVGPDRGKAASVKTSVKQKFKGREGTQGDKSSLNLHLKKQRQSD